MLSEEITFEPSYLYSREENGISEQIGRNIMDMTWATIIGENISDDLWLEIALAIMHVKNIWPICTLKSKISYKLFQNRISMLDHLRVLGSIVYVLIHEEKQKRVNSKSAKFAARAKSEKLVGYNGKTIYHVYFEKDPIIIWVKDLQIHKDVTVKESTTLPIYDAINVDKQGGNKVPMMTTISEMPKQKRSRPQKTTAAPMSNSDFKLSLPPTMSGEKEALSKQKQDRPQKTLYLTH